MTTVIALLRAVNLGAHRKVPMARLRELLSERGYVNPRTLLASGNVIIDSPTSLADTARDVARMIEAEWGFDVPVVVRSPRELRSVLAADPIPGAAEDPKKYQVTFFSAAPSPDAVADLDPAAYPGEYFHLEGAHLYTWTPAGIHASPLIRALNARSRGLIGTARNWDTITKISALTSGDLP